MPQMPAYSYRLDRAVPPFPDDKPVIVLDGYCNFCSRTAQYILSRDPAGAFRFVAAQSPLGEALFRHYGLKSSDYETMLLIEAGQVRVMSDAALRVMEVLRTMPWTTWAARGVPRILADVAYRLVARNRIRFWGAREVCYAHPPEYRDRFL